MKVLPFKIPKLKDVSLIYQEDKGKILYDKLHQHEEIQLCAIVKGEGSIVVGDSINEYKSGDILIIGSNLPHVFKSDTSTWKTTFMQTLFFTKTSFGEHFFELGDFKEIQQIFTMSASGGILTSNKNVVLELFQQLKKASNLQRFILFLTIIRELLKADIQPLSTFIYPKKYSDNEGKRMSNIMEFTMNNYQKEISLHSIAEISYMTPNAFCRYFKQRTNKTYFQFLIEVRIENACRLLKNKDLLITEISEKSGFKNISNFNRKFKENKGITPSNYRSLH
ncbi:Transcriptional activator NphR [Polaribacter huanghezhanensis]|uniref:AraC family transcriptional regulator n=1 Tax=Polaribacter huanghezhanensis TaxID=1354726 RepID=UPI00264A1FDD|nr:AraC family transcriptional regulator [Polaribacter huanghezhanensis]WKD85952.1 Transcriptional activator NphR [Polaribacter huanghezhanensis]